jgi:hypothetical protein
MTRPNRRFVWSLFVLPFLGLALSDAQAGGGWVAEPGHGYASIGYSQKTARTSWNSQGEPFNNVTGNPPVANWHDFRYVYVSGEAGVVKNVAVNWLFTWLDGYEGPEANPERNHGMSDCWLGARYAVRKGAWPVAAGFVVRTPFFYDMIGPYTRHLYNEDGEEVTLSPEWRGVLKHDYTVYGAVSRSLAGGRGWASLDAGFTWRAGSPADKLPINLDAGYPLPVRFRNTRLKVMANFVQSMGNEDPREPDDRFGGNSNFNFNDASMLRLAGSLVVDVYGPLQAELGYGQWVWGQSARHYKEPFFALGTGF